VSGVHPVTPHKLSNVLVLNPSSDSSKAPSEKAGLLATLALNVVAEPVKV
jgi:hypothetical protein